MKTLRAADERFDSLPGFPYEPHYCEIPSGHGVDLRVHYLDEGPRDGPVVLLLHGEPTWSYLWRKVIPALSAAGIRVVALDLPGFGRSDKPDEAAYFSFEGTVQWTRLVAILRLELDRITVVGHGLGALIGLSLAAAHWRSVERVVAVSSLLPLGSPKRFLAKFSAADYAAEVRGATAGGLVQRHTVREMVAEEVAAYDAPFAGPRHRAAIGSSLERVDDLGGSVAEHLGSLWQEVRKRAVDVLFLSGEKDELAAARGGSPGGGASTSLMVADAGHFLPEDKPEALAEILLDDRHETDT